MALACLILCAAPGTGASAPVVSVFPVPGSVMASPGTQIAFRGIPISQLGSITVTGSRSGVQNGKTVGDSDGRGGSFMPFGSYTPGEVVTVSTGLNILGASNGTFHFTVASPAGGIPPLHWPPAVRSPGDVWRFRSRPDLAPPAAVVTRNSSQIAPGDLFLAPQFGPVQDGVTILDSRGGLVWFKRLNGDTSASDFRVQQLGGRPVLTWWQGYVNAGVGIGQDVINDSSYRQIAVVNGANGLGADLHEFQLSPQGTALITAYFPVYWDATSIHGPKRQIVLDSVVQEIDIPTGLVLFQWDSLDHVGLGDSHQPLPKAGTSNPFDYFHINSIEPDRDGNLVISARNTWAAYKIDHRSGNVIWTLGGRHSSFRLGPGAPFAFQHDVRVQANNDLFLTVFDDEAGPPSVQSQSRGLKLILDLKHMTARAVARHDHSPALSANFEGNFQQLPNGDDLVGWGQQPYVTEYDRRGRLLFDANFVDLTANYRAYRFPWTGTPITAPAVVATGGRTPTVYATWNGSTQVASWRVLGGAKSSTLKVMTTTRKTGFETAVRLGSAQRFVAVQALDGSGRVLATSPTVASH
jgi:arylsulfotransferase ASST